MNGAATPAGRRPSRNAAEIDAGSNVEPSKSGEDPLAEDEELADSDSGTSEDAQSSSEEEDAEPPTPPPPIELPDRSTRGRRLRQVSTRGPLCERIPAALLNLACPRAKARTDMKLLHAYTVAD